jgi:hypothetical protein
VAVATLLVIVGLVIALLATYYAAAPHRSAKRLVSVDRFRATRRHLKAHIGELFEQAIAEQKESRADEDLALLTKPGWVPAEPLPLESVHLRLRDETTGESLAPARAKVRDALPRSEGGGEIESYSEAIGLFDRPNIWFDSCSYRLLNAEITAEETSGMLLEFSLARYFDAQDTTEFLGYELADRHARGKPEITTGGYRKWLKEPFDLSRRCGIPGISALTIRQSSKDASFFMHRRDAAQVAVAMNTTHVAPAGEFQPHNDVLPVWKSDLDIWHSVMREYAEEFLAVPEVTGRGGFIIDYDRDAPYREFNKARRAGDVQVRFLGLGVDPLTWKPEICVVCVWKASAFDRTFSKMVERNEEGLLITGERSPKGYKGLPFTAANVLGYADQPTTLPTGRTCLKLAWRWRHSLGLAVD